MTIDTIHHRHPSPWTGPAGLSFTRPCPALVEPRTSAHTGQAHQLPLGGGDPSPVVHPASSLLEAWQESNRLTTQGHRALPAPRTRGLMLSC